MAEFLVIRLDADTDAATWIAVDGDGTRVGAPGAGSLEEAGRLATGRDVIVLVPASNVLTTVVDIPVKRGRHLLSALSAALEEDLADDIENLHFAPGAERDDHAQPVTALGRARPWRLTPRLDAR